jgi:hypothetical protein
MNSPAAVSLKGTNEVFIKKSYTKELLAVAKGMKKDGFSHDEIAQATKLPLSLVNSLFR